MLRTFNCGAGLIIVAAPKDRDAVIEHIGEFCDCYEIGTVEAGDSKVCFESRINWL